MLTDADVVCITVRQYLWESFRHRPVVTSDQPTSPSAPGYLTHDDLECEAHAYVAEHFPGFRVPGHRLQVRVSWDGLLLVSWADARREAV